MYTEFDFATLRAMCNPSYFMPQKQHACAGTVCNLKPRFTGRHTTLMNLRINSLNKCLSRLKSVLLQDHLYNKRVTLVLSQNTDTVVNFMIKLPVDLSEVPPYIIKVRIISSLNVSIKTSFSPLTARSHYGEVQTMSCESGMLLNCHQELIE